MPRPVCAVGSAAATLAVAEKAADLVTRARATERAADNRARAGISIAEFPRRSGRTKVGTVGFYTILDPGRPSTSKDACPSTRL